MEAPVQVTKDDKRRVERELRQLQRKLVDAQASRMAAGRWLIPDADQLKSRIQELKHELAGIQQKLAEKQ